MKRTAVLICAIFTVLAESVSFRSDYEYFEEVDGWLKLYLFPLTWRDARFRCQLEGTVLASPLHEGFHHSMVQLLKNSNQTPRTLFTGIHSIFSNTDYFSVEGTPLSSIPVTWAPNEPDNYHSNENCLALDADGTVSDVSCEDLYRFICYKKRTDDMKVTECGTIDPAYHLEPTTGSCYKFHSTPSNWTRAFMTCAAEGGYLAIINSEDEAQIFAQMFAKHPNNTAPLHKDRLYLGFLDWNETGSWFTIQGQTLEEAGYPIWNVGEPNNIVDKWTNFEGEHCGSMYTNGRLNDKWCRHLLVFICEKDPNSLRDSYSLKHLRLQ